jgi:hypothetical protein
LLTQGWGDDKLENESAFAAHNRRAWDSVRESYEYFMYPPKKSLLPPLPKHMHKDLTICVELTDTLTHMVWEVYFDSKLERCWLESGNSSWSKGVFIWASFVL